MKKHIDTSIIRINSGETLFYYLYCVGMEVSKGHTSGLESSANCIYLPDKTSFNWKSRNGEVRVNCKEETKRIVERVLGIRFMENGIGDKTRTYSYLTNNENDLLAILRALCEIDGNGKVEYPK